MGGSDAGDPVRARAAMDESMPEKFKFRDPQEDSAGQALQDARPTRRGTTSSKTPRLGQVDTLGTSVSG